MDTSAQKLANVSPILEWRLICVRAVDSWLKIKMDAGISPYLEKELELPPWPTGGWKGANDRQ